MHRNLKSRILKRHPSLFKEKAHNMIKYTIMPRYVFHSYRYKKGQFVKILDLLVI